MDAETVYLEATLYIVINEDGDVTADADRETAIERMRNDYGGDTFRIIEMEIKTPRPKDYIASLILNDENGEPLVRAREES
jgi:hypothetical protein